MYAIRSYYASYEEDFLQDIAVGTPSPTENGWVYPALFRYGDTWIVLSETGMDGHYAGSSLAQTSEDGLYQLRFPQPPEVFTNGRLLPEARLPFASPWRLVLAGDLATQVESTLGTDLALPSQLDYTGFLRITSYNVCYTKLLRGRPPASRTPPSPPRCRAGCRAGRTPPAGYNTAI